MLLTVEDLHVHFRTDSGIVHAVNGLNFSVDRGETLGIVGESGSGKSVSCLAVMGLLPMPPASIPRGVITFAGQDLNALSARERQALRGNRIAMVFQDPMTSLNPFLRVSRQLTEVLEWHQGLSPKAALSASIEMLERVGIPDASKRIHHYPHEFSGGMRQRVMIAMGLLCQPELLIADEPTTALDVTIQAQILELLKTLQKDLGMAVLLITHDVGVVAGTADRVLVMYAGSVMEYAQTGPLFNEPGHPYTHGLLKSVPRLDQHQLKRLNTIPGSPPVLGQDLNGCPFAPRCDYVADMCLTEFPTDQSTDPARKNYCWHIKESSK